MRLKLLAFAESDSLNLSEYDLEFRFQSKFPPTRAGKHFSSAIAMIGVNVVIAMVAHTAAKGVNAKLKATAAQRKTVTAQEIQAKLNAQKPKANSSQPNTPTSTLVVSGVLSQEFISSPNHFMPRHSQFRFQ